MALCNIKKIEWDPRKGVLTIRVRDPKKGVPLESGKFVIASAGGPRWTDPIPGHPGYGVKISIVYNPGASLPQDDDDNELVEIPT